MFPSTYSVEKFVVLLLIVSGTSLTLDEIDGPKILFDKEYTFNAGDSISIACLGSKPLQWTFENASLYSQSQTNLTNNTYKSDLHIGKASYLNTGFYFCHQSGDPYYAGDSIYIFVRDENHLTILKEDLATFDSIQFTELIIPCRPTSPDVEVKLYKSDDLVQDSYDEYDPKIGFKFPKIHIKDEGLYSCKFTRNDQTVEIELYVAVHTNSETIAQPRIYDLSMNHTVVGELLVLNCTLKEKNPSFNIDWIVPQPRGLENHRIDVIPVVASEDNHYYSLLKVYNVSKQDQGEYMCRVKDYYNNTNNATIDVKIFDVNDNFIRVSEENDVYAISELAGRDALWSIDIDAHPIKPLYLRWLNNKGDLISEWEYRDGQGSKFQDSTFKSRKYETNFTTTNTVLKINYLDIDDYGKYTLIADNENSREEKTFTLYIEDKPLVKILSDEFHLLGSNNNRVTCSAKAYPEAKISWKIKNCIDDSCKFIKKPLENHLEISGMQVTSTILLDTNSSKTVECTAVNAHGEETVTQQILITDVSNGFSMVTSENLIKNDTSFETNNYLVAVNDQVVITCSASVYKYQNGFLWLHNDKIINYTDDDLITFESGRTNYSAKSSLTIRRVLKHDSGNYSCQVKKLDADVFDSKNLTLEVADVQGAIIIESNMHQVDILSMDLPENVTLTCYVKGIPKPSIDWLKNNAIIALEANRTEILEDGQVFNIRKTNERDEGVYSCSVSNKAGYATEQIRIHFKNKPSHTLMIIIIVILSVLFIICFIGLMYKIYQERMLQKELEQMGLKDFNDGKVASINPELALHDQVHLLPYDSKWEIPKERLIIGKQIGEGAFGMVMQAEAYGIKRDEEKTIVAVKMVKQNSDDATVKALTSELKILVHLGKHLNIVNLLGASTKHLAKRELYIVVEYCRYGNMHKYLQTHRDLFVDQIDRKTGKLDFSIGSDFFDRPLSFSSYRSNSHSSRNGSHIKYPFLKLNSDNTARIQRQSDSVSDDQEFTGQSMVTQSTNVSSPRGDVTGGSIPADWGINYEGDYKKNSTQFITTKDLLVWGFQLARGMDYLASRKVLHGDLAARNILLADNNVIKICDFGLAKTMYQDNNYKKTSNGLLPIKWMAVESLGDKIFSTQSDIWSFGIVLWEFFSLGKIPYPGMEANENFYHKIFNGYRMESPKFATKEIYGIMKDCWHQNPNNRPSFHRLGERIGDILSDKEKQLYIDLNDPYLEANTFRLHDQDDYLSMMSPPDFKHISSPKDYENDSIRIPLHPDGYLPMRPGMIFSPTSTDSHVFNFDDESAKTSSPVQDSQIELQPMLNWYQNELPNLQTKQNGFFNPSYGFLPPGKNNYVNVNVNDERPAKNRDHVEVINHKDKENLPEGNYVNSTSRDWEQIRI